MAARANDDPIEMRRTPASSRSVTEKCAAAVPITTLTGLLSAAHTFSMSCSDDSPGA